MDRHTQYYSELENHDKVYEKTSVAFTAADPQTKTLQLASYRVRIVVHLPCFRRFFVFLSLFFPVSSLDL